MSEQLLNLACGSKVSAVGAWTNIDFQSSADDVIEADILRGLPFGPNTFDVVYSAQFIEHLTLEQGECVLRDVARIMKPGGLIRLVTPDLEELTRTYLASLEAMKTGPSDLDRSKYEWIRLEIFDQIERDFPDGETRAFLAASDDATRAHIIDRLGHTATTFFTSSNGETHRFSLGRIWRKRNRIFRRVWQIARNIMATDTMRVGRFRRSGEVHRYLHDFQSLTLLLEKAGFHSVKRVDAHRSSIPNWSSYELDVINGVVDGPLSLYVEARV